MSTDILHFDEIIRNNLDASLVIYNRASGWAGAGKGKEKLREKTTPAIQTVLDHAPGRLRFIALGIESGKLSKPRPKLIEAAMEAAKRNSILVAPDWSRFIRAEAYNRSENRDARPTAEEYAQLHELTLHVPLATIESPHLSESKRHSLATRRTGKAGRRPTIDDDLAHLIFHALGGCGLSSRGEVWDGGTLAEIAKAFGTGVATVLRAANRMSPYGVTWRELARQQARDGGRGFALRCPYRTESYRRLEEYIDQLDDVPCETEAEFAARFAKWKAECYERAKRCIAHRETERRQWDTRLQGIRNESAFLQ